MPLPHPRAAVLLMVLGLLSPLLLGLDSLAGPYSSLQTAWSETIARRVEAHAASITTPKIMFIGGSNMVFGIHAHDLQAALGVPVVDYAVNAGIGFDVIADRAARFVRPGDVIIAAPELPHFTDVGPIDPSLRRDFVGLFPVRFRDPGSEFPLRQWYAARERSRAVVAASEAWWTRQLMKWWLNQKDGPAPEGPVSAYDLRAIDAEGNIIYPRPGVAPGVDPAKILPPWPLREQYNFVNSFGVRGLKILAQACREQHATFLIMPAVRSEGEASIKRAFLEYSRQREADMIALAESLGAKPLLGAGETAVEPRFTYDTLYHLNDGGVAIIQERLLKALRPIAERMRGDQNPAPPP